MFFTTVGAYYISTGSSTTLSVSFREKIIHNIHWCAVTIYQTVGSPITNQISKNLANLSTYIVTATLNNLDILYFS